MYEWAFPTYTGRVGPAGWLGAEHSHTGTETAVLNTQLAAATAGRLPGPWRRYRRRGGLGGGGGGGGGVQQHRAQPLSVRPEGIALTTPAHPHQEEG
jgi:hypothetical protein